MANFEGKSFEELKACFEEVIANYGKRTPEEEKRADELKESHKAATVEIVGVLDLARTEHFAIEGGKLVCTYPVTKRTWEGYDYVEEIVMEKSNGSFTVRVAEIIRENQGLSSEAIFEEIKKKAVHEVAWLLSNYCGNFTPELMASYWNELSAILSCIRFSCIPKVLEVIGRHYEEDQELLQIQKTWAERKNDLDEVVLEMRCAWLGENPLESLVGEEVFCTSKGYRLPIESVDSKWVKFTNGEKCKRDNVDLWEFMRRQSWLQEVERIAYRTKRGN